MHQIQLPQTFQHHNNSRTSTSVLNTPVPAKYGSRLVKPEALSKIGINVKFFFRVFRPIEKCWPKQSQFWAAILDLHWAKRLLRVTRNHKDMHMKLWQSFPQQKPALSLRHDISYACVQKIHLCLHICPCKMESLTVTIMECLMSEPSYLWRFFH